MPSAREKEPLNQVELEDALAGLEGWVDKGGWIERVFRTGGFMRGLELVQRIAEAAEEMNHHPDVFLAYPKVKIKLLTHDLNAVTALDTKLAARINEIALEEGLS